MIRRSVENRIRRTEIDDEEEEEDVTMNIDGRSSNRERGKTLESD
jgi:hypothetical protein